MLHRVMPAHHERYCLTVWLDGDHNVNSERDLQVKPVPSVVTFRPVSFPSFPFGTILGPLSFPAFLFLTFS